MNAYFILSCLLSIVYGFDVTIDVDDPMDAALCENGRIKPAELPFESKKDAERWMSQNQMCYFLFVNEEATYPDILEDVVMDSTKVCWGKMDPKDTDKGCEDPMDSIIIGDINELRKYVDIHKQEYSITDFKHNSFTVSGIRYVRIEPGMSVPGFMADKVIENEFEEVYEFQPNGPNKGKLKRRTMTTKGALARKLLQAGLIKYAHFAKSVGQMIDIPERFKYDGDNVYYIQINNIVAVVIFIVIIGITLITLCYSCKLFKSCLCDKKKVHQYHKVKPKDIDSTDME